VTLTRDNFKIISGGQTGVDRAALDAAMDLGIPVGGWCPAGRRSEDGRIPEKYPLLETASIGYNVRTIRNIADAAVVLLLYWGKPTGGTFKTKKWAKEVGRARIEQDLEKMFMWSEITY
jgi:hypothetical protein